MLVPLSQRNPGATVRALVIVDQLSAIGGTDCACMFLPQSPKELEQRLVFTRGHQWITIPSLTKSNAHNANAMKMMSTAAVLVLITPQGVTHLWAHWLQSSM